LGVLSREEDATAEEALGGIGKQIESLKKQIGSGAFEGDALKAAQGILNDVTELYNKISNTLNSARKAAKEAKEAAQ
jgi:hypothetical protein